jgi:hypothetical protein
MACRLDETRLFPTWTKGDTCGYRCARDVSRRLVAVLVKRLVAMFVHEILAFICAFPVILIMGTTAKDTNDFFFRAEDEGNSTPM